MSALDFTKSDDTSDVVFADAQVAEGDEAVARGVEQRFEDAGYVSVSNVKGFTKPAVPKASTRRSARHILRSAPQSTSSDPVDLSDDIEVSEGQGPDVKKEKTLVVHGQKKASAKKVFQRSNVCANVLAHFAPPGARDAISEMEDDHFISRLMLSSCNLSALMAEGVTRFQKGMQEYEEFSKKKEKVKSSMAVMKKEINGFSKKEEAWVKKVGELTRRHEIEMNDLKKSFEADKLKLKADTEALDVQRKAFDEEKEGLKAFVAQETGDKQWLIEQGFHQVVTYLFHSYEFNSSLGEVYTKLLNYGKHLGLIAGFKLHESGQAVEQSPMFRPDASGVFKESV
ncbi:hypothetical protein Hanom_Chr15g01376881 [Helianthus anomalus]